MFENSMVATHTYWYLIFGFLAVSLASCSQKQNGVKPMEIDLPNSTPTWVIENLEGTDMVQKEYIFLSQKQTPLASAYLFIKEHFSNELLLSFTVKGDTTYVQWMSYVKAYELTGRGRAEAETNPKNDVRMREPFENVQLKIPTSVWIDFLEFNANRINPADSTFDEDANFIMLIDAHNQPKFLTLNYGSGSNDSEFELLELINQNRYSKSDPGREKAEEFIYPLDSISSDVSIHMIVNRTFQPIEEIVCYPTMAGKWQCHYTVAEYTRDSLDGVVHSRSKNSKTGEEYFLVLIKDTSFAVDEGYATAFLNTLEESTITYPDFSVSMPTFDGVHYFLSINIQGKCHQKKYGNPPKFMREVMAMTDFLSIVWPDF